MVGLCVRMCQGAGNDGGTRGNDAPDNDQFCRMKMGSLVAAASTLAVKAGKACQMCLCKYDKRLL